MYVIFPVLYMLACIGTKISYLSGGFAVNSRPFFRIPKIWNGFPWFRHKPIPTNICHENNTNCGCYIQKHKNRKLICISPAGFKGFYLSGVIAYIKENYDTEDFIFSGASAGAWNALLFTYKGNLTELIYGIAQHRQTIYRNESIRDYKYFLKNHILEHYTEADFDLDRIYIGVTTLRPYIYKRPTPLCEYIQNPNAFFKTSIYSHFTSLEEVLDCCIASSHIPFFMGRVFHTYQNTIVFDGGFSQYPYYPFLVPTLNITPTIWSKPKPNLSMDDYTTLLSREKYNFLDLFWQGYEDTRQNHETLEEILLYGNGGPPNAATFAEKLRRKLGNQKTHIKDS